VTQERSAAHAQLACVTDIMSELSYDPEKRALGQLEVWVRSPLAARTLGPANQERLLAKVNKLAGLRAQTLAVRAKIGHIATAVRALRVRLQHIVVAFWK